MQALPSGAAVLGLYGERRLGPLTAPADLTGALTGLCIAPSPERMRDIGLDPVAPEPQDRSMVIQAGRKGAFAG